jgi:hypothetical protein
MRLGPTGIPRLEEQGQGKSITITRRSPATASIFIKSETEATDREIEGTVEAITSTDVGWVIVRGGYAVQWMVSTKSRKVVTITVFPPEKGT